MRKSILKISVLPLLLALFFPGFTHYKMGFGTGVDLKMTHKVYAMEIPEFNRVYSVDTLQKLARAVSPELPKDFIRFRKVIGFQESRNFYWIVNPYGYMGKYQFGPRTLSALGVHNTQKFLKDPELQEKAFYAYVSLNKWNLEDDIRKYVGDTIGGVKITTSGIIAAAHLAGPGGVRQFLKSDGERAKRDAFGTTVKYYMKKFGGYDLSDIPAKKGAKIQDITVDERLFALN